ncbi:nucleolar complex protein 2 homolog [Vigna radiata var. radiata]|uniref:Nucleolar complex protein 2 homolog n=1 Tax=Vigna radiata var. radiata TaxID=3916 RepID=A0A1S3VIT1_VIGRR|nr:nucleolar complex protein 2 homolog [Vigna radiata var. radiata]
MGKLGKKARKFAKKNLQSVLRNKRKLNSKFKRKASKRDSHDIEENLENDTINPSNERNIVEGFQDTSLDAIFSEDDSEILGDDSDSDGFLSEDSSFLHDVGSDCESEHYIENSNASSSLSVQNRDLCAELLKKAKKLNKLREKDLGFSKFLESYDMKIEETLDEEIGSDDGKNLDLVQPLDRNNACSHVGKHLTSASVYSLCKLVKEQSSVPALTCLINAYRAACHNDSEATSVSGCVFSDGIQKSETFSKIILFMLQEADATFRRLLGISNSSSRKEAVLDLKNTKKWLSLRPLIKSYLRSTVFLLNQVTDSELLAFSICRLRTSIIFLCAFPSLLHNLLKISIHLWATGDGSLSTHSFLIIQDIASISSSEWFDFCFVKTYKAFISNSQSVERKFEHIRFLRNSFVELCCLDMQKSSNKAMACILHLGKILQKGWQTKKKEVVKTICSWQYINCIDMWVTLISASIHDYDLQPLLYMIVQIINGVALLFPGPRYLPLRLRCIQWLNNLSGSSGIFIPVTSLVLDVLEYKIAKDSGKPAKVLQPMSTVKLPKHWLKSRGFQEECVLSAIELLSEHFAQWSYHISFPELATAPLIHLKKVFEKISTENFRRVIKRFIDQVEMNIDYVQKKREDVSFSPKDHQSVESFLQVEKRNGNTPFTQYYKNIMSKAASRNSISDRKATGKGKSEMLHPNGSTAMVSTYS